MARQKPQTNAPENGVEEPENLDKIRDILFGSHVRAVEGRLARFEERVAEEQSDLRADVEKALATLDAYVRKEVEALNGHIKAEQTRRTADLKELTAELKDSVRTLDKRIAQLDEATGSADADIRSQLVEQGRDAAMSLKQAVDALSSQLHEAEQSLRAEKMDTASLLAIFSDMTVRLSEEMPVPPEP